MSNLNEIQLADRCDLSPRTPEQWRWRGVGPRYLKIGGRGITPLAEVERYEASRNALEAEPPRRLVGKESPHCRALVHQKCCDKHERPVRCAALQQQGPALNGSKGPKAPAACLAANGPRPARATISAAVTGLQRCDAGLWRLRFTGHAALRSPLAPNHRAAPCPPPAGTPLPAMRASRPSPAPKRLRLGSSDHESAAQRSARRHPLAAWHGARMAARQAPGVLIVLFVLIGAGPRRAD
jgi:hypothetical protein